MKNGELTGIVKTNFCTACECLDPNAGGDNTDCEGSCSNTNWQGDGRCDDVNNNCGCEYDGGDCCESTVMKNGELTGIVKTNFWFVASFVASFLSCQLMQRNTGSRSSRWQLVSYAIQIV